MSKTRSKMMILIILSICFFILGNKNINTYALNEKANLDLLIENKKSQEELRIKINDLKSNLESKKNNIEKLENKENTYTENGVEVVSVSFVPEGLKDKNYSEKEEIESLASTKYELEKQLENFVIDSIKLEKSIEEEKFAYLKENNLQFINGIWPLQSYKEISSPFGERVHPITGEVKFHRGIDIPAPKNTDILSSDDGIVIFSGSQNGYGNVVKIKHFDGKKTVYAHNTSNVVKEGDIVKKGQVIAKVGTTGDSTGNHVHFETIVNDENINPINAVNK
ncbi:M23 family metallopeptidase [Clostridium sp. CCUG 7971]|uniref:M23 family metallopeptidase n=1 Tax=Clostridium sp. CCUG 7971 TaxID=2811414 RepID=UPI001ABABCC1|nr:M23 family metallopeptidase [Clostridium sp. CCUG 7971]MBO3445195.1 M23 family metallopeptidase [Clostridium sp. CCUG 7971]